MAFLRISATAGFLMLAIFSTEPLQANSISKKIVQGCAFALKAIYGFHDPTVRLNKVEDKERQVVPELKENEALIFTLGPGRKVLILNDPKKRQSEYIDLLYDKEKTTRIQIQHMPSGTSYFKRLIGFFNTHYKTQEVMLNWRVEKVELSQDGQTLLDLFRSSASGLGTTSYFTHEEGLRSLSQSLGEVISSEKIERRTRNEQLAAIGARSFIHGQKMAGMLVLATIITLMADSVFYEGRLLNATNLLQELFPVEYSFQNPGETQTEAYTRIAKELKKNGQYAQADMVDWLKEISTTGIVEKPNEQIARTIQYNLSQLENLPRGLQLVTIEAADTFSFAGNTAEVEREMIELVQRGYPVSLSFLLHIARDPINHKEYFELINNMLQNSHQREAEVALSFLTFSQTGLGPFPDIPENVLATLKERFPDYYARWARDED